MMRQARIHGWLTAAALASSACSPSSDAAPDLEALALLTVSEPTLEIGVVEGDPAYTFASIESVRRLGDGSIAVSDPGNTRISIFSPDGTFARAWGRRGGGPGEFRSLSRLYRLGADSLMAADNATARLTVFDLDGEMSRQVEGTAISQDEDFRLDSWLYGRFWIDGALDATARSRIRATLDRVPPPRAAPGFRTALVTREGDLWIREPTDQPQGAQRWTVVSPDGLPTAVVETPDRFTPLDVVDDEVVGRWLGPADVPFVRAYDLVGSQATAPAPSWLSGQRTGAPSASPMPEDEFQALMVSTIKRMASAQEIHYSQAYSYTTAMDSLDIELPEGLGVSFTHADPRGWAAVFVHPTADRLCGLAYGARIPPGWQAGGIQCGPSSAPPSQEP